MLLHVVRHRGTSPEQPPPAPGGATLPALHGSPLQGVEPIDFMQVLQDSPDGVVVITACGTILYTNEVTTRMFGYIPAELIGQSMNMLLPEPLRERHDLHLAALQATHESAIFGMRREVVGQHRDGHQIPLELHVSRLGGSTEARYIATVSDISARKRTELQRQILAEKLMLQNQELKQLRIAAEAANQAKSSFLANMSHEIRTPMTAILGFADVLLDHVRAPEEIDAVTTIKRNGHFLLEIINDILDLSKIESGKLLLERIPCSPAQIVSDVISLMRVRADAKRLPLEVEYEAPIPRTICTDPTRLRQVLINLIGNAIKFTETGGVRLVVRLNRDDANAPLLQFDVVDSGVGIGSEQIPRLFEPFAQADTSTHRRFGGTGLGLAISRRLTEMLGGSISVTSTLGKGSTFRITIATGPLQGATLEDQKTGLQHDSPPKSAHVESALAGPLPGRVLLAEDGPDNQRLISCLLRKVGAEVQLAENGQSAIEMAHKAAQSGNPFDVILMDMQMPVMDGYDSTRVLRADGYTGTIVALTAHAMIGDRERCLEAGCNDYLTKPIDRTKLLSLVEKYCGLRAIESQHA